MSQEVVIEATGRPARLAVLVSGTGDNLAALIQASENGDLGAEIAMVVADRGGIKALERAEAAGLATAVVPLGDYPNREAWDAALTECLIQACVDLVICAGFLKLLGPCVLGAFPGRVLNTHNSLLPSFPGLNAPRQALEAGVRVTGATLFLVDAGVDTGAIIAQTVVRVLDDDTEATLLERIKTAESEQLVRYLSLMVRHGWVVRGRRARPRAHC